MQYDDVVPARLLAKGFREIIRLKKTTVEKKASPTTKGSNTRKVSITRSSLHDEVVATLRDMIVTGDLKPGARILEHDLSEQLGVSRTPIREAIKILTLDGLVDSPAYRGARVKPLLADEIEALFDVIAVLESLAVERTTVTLSPENLSSLESVHEQMRDAFEAGDRVTYFDLNTRIHEWLLQLSGNPILIETHERLMLRANRGRYLAIRSNHRWKESMEQHEELMESLRAGDAARAGRIWRDHLTMTGETLLKSLTENSE